MNARSTKVVLVLNWRSGQFATVNTRKDLWHYKWVQGKKMANS